MSRARTSPRTLVFLAVLGFGTGACTIASHQRPATVAPLPFGQMAVHHLAAPHVATHSAKPRPTTTTAPTTTTPPRPAPTTSTTYAAPGPAPIPPLVAGDPASAWQASGIAGPAGPAVYTTQIQPAPGYPDVGVGFINTSRASIALFAGTTQPAGTWPHQGYVPPALYRSLAAAFNGGFQFNLGQGGWYKAGMVGAPLVSGDASLVVYDNGQANIGSWGSTVGMSPGVAAVRQNLTLLVNGGAPLGNLDANVQGAWGATLGNLVYTWRSGLGIDAQGNLIYVGGPSLDPTLLAEVLARAGAVRAMELDINPEWVSFTTFTDPPGTSVPQGTNLLGSMYFSPGHYLSPFWRDFVAVFVR